MKTEIAVDDNGGRVTFYVYSALDGWRDVT